VNVADKFGDQGLVGVVILCACGEVATIDTFLMSCRVIGRDIELVIVDTLVNLSKLLGIKKLNSSYNPTLKNVQVSNFYEICGFEVSKEQGDARQYELLIEDYRFKEIEYVRVINEFNSKIQTR
jgi:FkbH-like protein